MIWIDCNTAGAGGLLEAEPPPPQPAITTAITARHKSDDEICNFFMSVSFGYLRSEIQTGSLTANVLLRGSELSHFSGASNCEDRYLQLCSQFAKGLRAVCVKNVFCAGEIDLCAHSGNAIARCISANVCCRSTGLLPHEGAKWSAGVLIQDDSCFGKRRARGDDSSQEKSANETRAANRGKKRDL